MTPNGFRRIALGLTDVAEGAHHGHPDFRVGKRILASLGYPDKNWGMVVLTPEQQRLCVRAHPTAFVTVKGRWGEQGCTNVRLDAVDEEALGKALALAWKNVVAKAQPRRSAQAPVSRRKTRSKDGQEM